MRKQNGLSKGQYISGVGPHGKGLVLTSSGLFNILESYAALGRDVDVVAGVSLAS